MSDFLKSLKIKGIEVDTAGATTNQVLKFNGTKFAPGTASTVGALDDLSDVVITSPSKYQIINYDGTNWVNSEASVTTYVRNAESTTLNVGEVVYLYGAQGDRASVKRAINTSDAGSATTVGVVAASIPTASDGPVVTQGYLMGPNLTAYNVGDILYLGSTAGTLTATKPQAPNHLVYVGVVARNNSNGVLYVRTQNGYELDELHNVQINSGTLANGQTITYDSSTQLWKNTTPLGGATVSDTPPSSPSTGQLWFESDTAKTFVYYDSFWIEVGSGGGAGALDDLSDVAITSPVTGQGLTYNGSSWVNSTVSTNPMNDTKFSAIITMDIGV